MAKLQEFADTDGKKYHFTASGLHQLIAICSENDKNVVFELDYRNAYRLLDSLEKALDFIENNEDNDLFPD